MNIAPADLFATLGNETRLRCLHLVARHDEVCVCEVVDALKIAQPAASKALKALREIGLACDRRDANWIYYRLNESMPHWMAAIADATISELTRSKKYERDMKSLEKSIIRQRKVC